MTPLSPWHNTVVEGPVITIEFECPRCGVAAIDSYYGPCNSCRLELRATLGGGKRRVDAPEYTPKVNVRANAVALKDD